MTRWDAFEQARSAYIRPARFSQLFALLLVTVAVFVVVENVAVA